MTTRDLGVDLIRAERERQITDEGYTPEHDRAHEADDLIDAAIAYITGDPHVWPWHPDGFKPTEHYKPDPRDLVKAGALIAAAIDRLTDPKDL